MADEFVDGTVTFRGGQDDGLVSHQIGPEQYRRGINVSTRRGVLQPRPGFVHQELDIPPQHRQVFSTGKFQGGCSYDTENGEFLILCISGTIFRVDLATNKVDTLLIAEGKDRLSQYRRRIPWSHAGRFLSLFEFPNLPVFIENDKARRSNPNRESFPGVPLPEAPASVFGAFIQGRLWVVNDGNQYLAGDAVGGINSDAPITFEEIFGIAAPYAAQSFSLGSQSTHEQISAMGFLVVPDTSTGVGPMFVATDNSVYVTKANEPRANWQKDTFSRIFLYNAGIAGIRAWENANSDVIFLSGDNKVRTLYLNRSEQERWSNAPISREVGPFLEEFENLDLIKLAFVGYWNNRIFVSVAPFIVEALDLDGNPVFDYAHGGMIVLELDNVSQLAKSANPVWAGLWTGIYPMEMISTKKGPYFVSKDPGSINRLYKLDESISWDVFEGKERPITCRAYLKEYDFQNQFIDKKLRKGDYSLRNIDGRLSMLVEYKPGHMKEWLQWAQFEHDALETESKEGPINTASHDLLELNLGDPEEVICDPISKDESTTLRTLEVRLTMNARNWNLESARFKADAIPENDQRRDDICKKKNITLKTRLNGSDWTIHSTAPSIM